MTSLKQFVVLSVALASTVLFAQSVEAGIATRYFDCCKVSGAWPNKAEVDSPVRTCEADGVTEVKDPNAPSGCQGGKAFTCHDQQPFNDFKNKNLSYAFAAFSTAEPEEATSCACYHARFDLGEKGERDLIFQAINTGGDVNQGNVDLQIPGGGIGAMQEGCPAAMPGVKDWGQQYGGYAQVGSCDDLPETLKNGCMWRFETWADNPPMKDQPKRVQCPAPLLKLSGCRRKDESSQAPWDGVMDSSSMPKGADQSSALRPALRSSEQGGSSGRGGKEASNSGDGGKEQSSSHGSNTFTSTHHDDGKGKSIVPEHKEKAGKGESVSSHKKESDEDCPDDGRNAAVTHNARLQKRHRLTSLHHHRKRSPNWNQPAASRSHAQMSAYYDSCVQSGSWPGKADVYHPVKVCNKEGKPFAENDWIYPGCGNGAQHTHYACPDLQPFWDGGIEPRSSPAGLPTLLGFVAVNGATSNEAQMECACYEAELYKPNGGEQFANIVYQVTNIGGLELHGDIDLHMGTGGMGVIRDGCPRQFGNRPWLNTASFGGIEVKSSQTCAAMFSGRNANTCMEAGCQISHTIPWNPEIKNGNDKRVACPKSLLAASWCQRKDEYQQKRSLIMFKDAQNSPPPGWNTPGFRFDYAGASTKLGHAASLGQCGGSK